MYHSHKNATAIGIPVLRGDMKTAGSIMFLPGIGELLEERTHKKPAGGLARSMFLSISRVWLRRDGDRKGIADIMVGSDDLYALVTLKMLSNALVGRIRKDYRVIVGFNTALILPGIGGYCSLPLRCCCTIL